MPLVSPEAFASFADALAERAAPEIGEIAELERAYEDAFFNGVTVIRDLAEQHRVDLHPDAA